MKQLSTRFLSGPNVHHRESVLVLKCDLGALAGRSLPEDSRVNGLPGSLPDALRELDALWRDVPSNCSSPVDRMLHVALSLQRDLCVRPANFATVLSVSESVVEVALQCEIPAIGFDAWALATASAELFLVRDAGQSARLIAGLAESHGRFLNRAHLLSLDQLTLALVRAAAQRDIPWIRLGYPHRFVQLGQGRNGRRLHETMLETTSYFAVRLTANKAATHQLLERLAFPQPQQILVETSDQAVQAAAAIGYPVVVKPCHGGKGQGVSVRVTTPEQVRQAFVLASQGNDSVVVESFVAGDDHRLLVVAGRLIAAARRLPAFVSGDGRSTVAELVEQLNRDPRRGRDYRKLMNLVEIDQEAVAVLASQGLTASSVLIEGCRILLRRTANISRGGTAEDVTDIMHPDNVRLAEDVARVVGLDVTGIDFLTADISRSWREVGGGIIEVNPNPGLRPHWIDNRAQRDVAGPILDRLLGDAIPKRIPTVAITGSLGKTTTCRMVAHILRATGRRVALTTTTGSFIDDRQVHVGDYAGGYEAINLMLDPAVEAGVFEMARGGLLKRGMALDRVDVGAVLCVHDNHVGLDGVESREQLAAVKAIVAANCSEMAVLNADDPLCLAMRAKVRSRRLSLFSEDNDHPELVAHRKAGGCTVGLSGRDSATRILLSDGSRVIGELPASAIPATLSGIARAKAINAAFAVAIVHGLGIEFLRAAAALGTFDATPESNPGRLNLIGDLPFRILVDWADGPVATAELASVVERLLSTGRRRVLFICPGNRPESFITGAAKSLAGGFDDYICSNHDDLRGRQPSEVPSLLRQGLLDGGVAPERIICIEKFGEALDAAFALSEPGDLLVVDSYMTDFVLQRITELRKRLTV